MGTVPDCGRVCFPQGVTGARAATKGSAALRPRREPSVPAQHRLRDGAPEVRGLGKTTADGDCPHFEPGSCPKPSRTRTRSGVQRSLRPRLPNLKSATCNLKSGMRLRGRPPSLPCCPAKFSPRIQGRPGPKSPNSCILNSLASIPESPLPHRGDYPARLSYNLSDGFSHGLPAGLSPSQWRS